MLIFLDGESGWVSNVELNVDQNYVFTLVLFEVHIYFILIQLSLPFVLCSCLQITVCERL